MVEKRYNATNDEQDKGDYFIGLGSYFFRSHAGLTVSIVKDKLKSTLCVLGWEVYWCIEREKIVAFFVSANIVSNP